MSLTDILLAAGLIPTVFIAYWLFRGVLLSVAHSGARPVIVTVRTGGYYTFVALLLVLSAVAGAVLTLIS